MFMLMKPFETIRIGPSIMTVTSLPGMDHQLNDAARMRQDTG